MGDGHPPCGELNVNAVVYFFRVTSKIMEEICRCGTVECSGENITTHYAEVEANPQPLLPPVMMSMMEANSTHPYHTPSCDEVIPEVGANSAKRVHTDPMQDITALVQNECGVLYFIILGCVIRAKVLREVVRDVFRECKDGNAATLPH